MKIAILTLNGYENHGNRLQNYALEKLLSNYGEVSTVFQHSGNYALNKKNFLSIYNKYKNLPIPLIHSIIKSEISIKDNGDAKIKRFLKFKVFSENNLKEAHYLINNDMEVNRIQDDFDVFVVGSDQVWNPTWQEGNLYCLLPFKTNAKKISIAASFGVDSLKEKKEWYRDFLQSFDYITVREHKGIAILKDLGIESEICLDPTLLLSPATWEANIVPIKEDNKYIALYFLGEVPEVLKEFLESINNDLQYKIINLNEISDAKHYAIDPFQFISYLKNAELILTDSYHGIIFSNILNTPFVIFERNSNMPNMNSRIETLDILFKVKERSYEIIKENLDRVFENDFSFFNKNIDKYRENSIRNIKKMVGISENEQ